MTHRARRRTSAKSLTENQYLLRPKQILTNVAKTQQSWANNDKLELHIITSNTVQLLSVNNQQHSDSIRLTIAQDMAWLVNVSVTVIHK